MSDARDLIKRIGEVAEEVALQAGVGASETAGMIVSTLYKSPDIIPVFMAEGSGLIIDGEIGPETGCLSFYSQNGQVTTPGELRVAIQARRILISAGARPGKGRGHAD